MKWSSLTFLSKALITVSAAAIVGAAVYFLSPGLKVDEAKKLDKLDRRTQIAIAELIST